MCLYKGPNIVDETLGSTDTGMKLTSGTDCDNPLATGGYLQSVQVFSSATNQAIALGH